MKKGTYGKRLLWMWIISYLLIFIIPLIFMQFFFGQTSKVVEDNLQAINRTELAHVQDNLDKMLTEIRDDARRILLSPEAESLEYAKKPLPSHKLIRIGELQDQMRSNVARSLYIKEMYLVFNELQAVTSTKGYYSNLESFYQSMEKEKKVLPSQLKEKQNENSDFSVLLISEGESQRASHMLVIVKPSLIAYRSNISCILVIDLNRVSQAFINQSKNITNHSLLWAASKENGLLLSANEMINIGEERFAAEELNAKYMNKDTDKHIVINTTSSSIGNLTYLCAVSSDEYHQVLKTMKQQYSFYLIVCISLGIGVMVFFSRGNYKPMSRMGNKLKIQSGKGLKREYDAFETALEALMEKGEKSESLIVKQQNDLQKAVLARILQGHIYSKGHFEEMTESCGMFFPVKQFVFLGIVLWEKETGKKKNETYKEERLISLILPLSQSIMGGTVQAYYCVLDGALYGMLSPKTSQDESTFEEQIGCFVHAIADEVEVQINMKATVYITALYSEGDDAQGIVKGAEEVLFGIREVIGFNIQKPVVNREELAHEIADANDNGYSKDRYIKDILNGNLSEPKKNLIGVLESQFIIGDKSFEGMRLRALMLLENLFSQGIPPNGENAKCANRAKHFFEAVRQTQNMNQLALTMEEAGVYVYSLYKAAHQKSSLQSVTYAGVVEYVETYYADPNLSVAVLCDHFNVSASFLLKMFKSASGTGVLDIIHRTRIHNVKRILLSTEDTIAQIAQATGYTNSLALIRAFKRIEGITPTEYRNIFTSQP